MSLTDEQSQRVTTLKKRLNTAAKEVKAINEQGRAAINDPAHINMFRGMITALDRYYLKCESYRDQISEIYDSAGVEKEFPTQKDNELYQAIRSYYFEALATREAIDQRERDANKQSVSSNINASNSTFSEARSKSSLPKINLPTFDGKILEWPRYKDTFEALVHNDANLTNIEKFHYLNSSIKGPAIAVIAHLQIQDTNYTLAWQALLNNFDKKRILAGAYLNQLTDFKPLPSKPSVQSFQAFLHQVGENVSAFKLLGIPNQAEFILFHLAIKGLDPVTREQFELAHKATDYPTFDQLAQFCREKCLALQLSTPYSTEKYFSTEDKSHFGGRKFSASKKNIALMANANSLKSSPKPNNIATRFSENPIILKCIFCKEGAHSLLNCIKFNQSTVKDRIEGLKHFKGCKNCLSYQHDLTKCQSKWHCRFCPQKHHSMIHPETTISASNIGHAQNGIEDPSVNLNTMSFHANETSPTTSCNTDAKTMLGTARAEIGDVNGQFQTIRLVVDSGSQNSFITLNCLNRLGLPLKYANKRVSGIGQSIFDGTKGTTCCILRATGHPEPSLTSEAIVVKNITTFLPNFTLSRKVCEPYFNYNLADPEFYREAAIDFLAGADLLPDILNGAPFAIAANLPKLFPSIFGNLIMGKFPGNQSEPSCTLFSVRSHDDLNTSLKRFWELEEVNKVQLTKLTDEEEECERHFVRTHSRLPDGKYVVRLPFKPSSDELDNNEVMAKNRFLNLESRLTRNHNLSIQYREFMSEYIRLGHMTPTDNPSKYIIPHHCVSKVDRNESKLRVVFDASARTKTGSLNDCLLVGPKLQNNIVDILLRFRTHKIALVTDVVKMYRNILLHPSDRPFQHIFWRDNPNKDLMKYELNTVTYGLTSAPFLALRTLQQLSIDEGKSFPSASRALREDVYVDDVVSGAESVLDAKHLAQELTNLMTCGGFELSKWASNSPEVLNFARETKSEQEKIGPISISDKDAMPIKVLGMEWDPSSDVFTYKIISPDPASTKRKILSTIAKLYDPLGLVAPVVLLMKSFMQRLWMENLDWDTQIPAHLQRQWDAIVSELEMLSQVSVPRFLNTSRPLKFQLIGFSDASTIGYCATLYIRTTKDKDVQVHLLLSKTKVAPTKTISVPRLELCGALLLAKLYQSILPCITCLGQPTNAPRFFTDSEIVLNWLHIPSYKLKTFVANRVTEILDIAPKHAWSHVKSKENPSDHGSRGLMPSSIIDNMLWWHGPQWLQGDHRNWPCPNVTLTEDIPEVKVSPHTLMSITDTSSIMEWMERFSSYYKLVRSMSWIKRFIHNTRRPDTKRQGSLTMKEIFDAKLSCILLIQLHYFRSGQPENIKEVKQKHANLNLFEDSNGVIRVGGRLEKSDLSYNHKHPILLPPDTHFTKLLISYYHLSYLHPGPSLLQALLQTHYWVPSLRRLIRQTEFKCLNCYRAKAKAIAPFMADLPSYRITAGKPFMHVGTDFAGPFAMRESSRRKAALGKVYCCVFVCMATKAVHLEAVSRLTTEAFLASMDRFIARRGIPSDMYSDNGTNFIGAANQLKLWYMNPETQNGITNYGTKKGLQWHFNPPQSPHFGGLWERAVRSFKRVFVNISGDTPMTYEEFATLLARIEAILNSRPLCPLSPNPDDMEYLSPGHFLVGRPLVAIPEPTLCDVRENTLSRWQLVKVMSEHFWQRWRLEYLSTLQKRPKWTQSNPNLRIGDLVLIRDPNANYLTWPTARVIDLHPGLDNIVRVVTLKTPTSTYKRTVSNLVPLLPINSTLSDS